MIKRLLNGFFRKMACLLFKKFPDVFTSIAPENYFNMLSYIAILLSASTIVKKQAKTNIYEVIIRQFCMLPPLCLII
jgi:hypothetical protein